VILLDTTVVIDYARGKDAKLVSLLPKLSVAICGVVRAEFFAGARDPTHRASLLTLLSTFHHVVTPDTLWDSVGDNLAALRLKGITVPFADAAIATLGIESDLEVWARDPHFPMMQKILPPAQALSGTP
jgi:predicted nucleic acid-binding protein